jgi:hypothetical protein
MRDRIGRLAIFVATNIEFAALATNKGLMGAYHPSPRAGGERKGVENNCWKGFSCVPRAARWLLDLVMVSPKW